MLVMSVELLSIWRPYLVHPLEALLLQIDIYEVLRSSVVMLEVLA
jgi:hypothetical protein